MATHNGHQYVAGAVESVLSQSLSQFEFIIVDDASSDGTWEWLTTISDARLRLFRNEVNQGLAKSLNTGILNATADIIIRMDQDDVSARDRFARQVQMFRDNSELVLLGSRARMVYQNGSRLKRVRSIRPPIEDQVLRWRLLWENPFVHSSVAYRRQAVIDVGMYRLGARGYEPEDFLLWQRLATQGRIANLPQELISYRIHGCSMTQSRQVEVGSGAAAVSYRSVAAFLGPKFSQESYASLAGLMHFQPAKLVKVTDFVSGGRVIMTAFRIFRIRTAPLPKRELAVVMIKFVWCWAVLWLKQQRGCLQGRRREI